MDSDSFMSLTLIYMEMMRAPSPLVSAILSFADRECRFSWWWALLQPKVLYSRMPTWPCYVGLSVCLWFHFIRLQCDAMPSLIPDHQCRLLNDLGLCWSKDLIRPFRYFFSKYWLDENAMEGPSMKALWLGFSSSPLPNWFRQRSLEPQSGWNDLIVQQPLYDRLIVMGCFIIELVALPCQ